MSVIAQLQDILSHRPVKRKRAGWFCASRPAVRRAAAEAAVVEAQEILLTQATMAAEAAVVEALALLL